VGPAKILKRLELYLIRTSTFWLCLFVMPALYGERHPHVADGLIRKQYARAESLYRDALKEYANMLPADHQDVGVGKVKLGRAMLRQKRYADALNETLAGYTILSNKVGASNCG